MKAGRGGFGVIPVFEEHIAALDSNLTGGGGFGDRLMLLVKQLHLNSGQRLSDTSGPAFAPVGVGQCHTNLSHAVTFQQYLAGQALPALKYLHRAGGRARDIEAHVRKATGNGAAVSSVHVDQIVDELYVDGGHRHKHSEDAPCYLVTKTLQVQLGHQVNRGARPQGTTEHVDDAVDVVQGQEQGNDI